MSRVMARCALPISCALLMSLTGCDLRFEPVHVSDAELFCRQGGYGLGSTAYDDCIETSTARFDRIASHITEKVHENEQTAVPLVVNVETTEAEFVSPSESTERVGQATPLTTDPPNQSSFAVHLSSVRNRADTRSEWNRLQKLYPDLLEDSSLMVRFVDLEERGIYFRVLTGPFTTYAKARDVCAMFKSRDQYCLAMRIGEHQAELFASSR